ncbi:type II secretion system protein GspJ [Paenibacillus doosanensis]|uniref:type II secretion system protein GspJ n=1 Tax=Paenibacillus doosanensis TaxID=1229154 RepID=UPI0021805DD4|nr:type II secretion system protein GspJ [Paenibacillus doosanensis]MCS7460559.1 type II secretion system protein GspJ [Paenibacillus doosanensis]
MKLDLLQFNASNRCLQPVPAAYIIDKDKIIRHSYVNPDFMQRMEPQEIVAQLNKLSGSN